MAGAGTAAGPPSQGGRVYTGSAGRRNILYTPLPGRGRCSIMRHIEHGGGVRGGDTLSLAVG
eukprot:905938-Heterocapsa_arctica.AAC.1